MRQEVIERVAPVGEDDAQGAVRELREELPARPARRTDIRGRRPLRAPDDRDRSDAAVSLRDGLDDGRPLRTGTQRIGRVLDVQPV